MARQVSERVPPGQSVTTKWPVLHYGSVPRFNPATWDFKLFELMAADRAGFWERNGYHMHGDPWKEERCSTPWS